MQKLIISLLAVLLIISSCKLKEGTTTPVDTTTTDVNIKVVAPNGGEILPEGSAYQIQWSGIGLPLVRISFSSDNGSTWKLIVDSLKNVGVYTWFPVPNSISNQCRISVSSLAGTSSDQNDQVFSIVKNSNKSLRLVQPKGQEQWEAGSAKQIKWYSSGLDSVKIEYTTDNGNHWNRISVDKRNTGIYYWEPVPNTPSTLAKIRIMDAKEGVPSSESDVFTILPEPIIKVLSPNGGERILAGTSRKIEWLSENIEKVKIAYSTNNGFDWINIVTSTPSTGFFVWEPVPNVNSQLCKIRVYDAVDGEPNDVSDSVFTITNQITQTVEVTSPIGGEKWQAGTNQTITWRSSGIPKVKLEFTTNNGLTWNTIIDNLQNTGAYEWNVPNSISTQCLIRVSDAVDGDPTSQSKAIFRIVPKPELRVTTPNGGEVWTAGVLDTIRWYSVGVENVFIDYTPDNGKTYTTIVEKTPSAGKYPYSFSVSGTLFKIRIIDADKKSPQDESDGTFTVLDEPKITVLSPNGGEEWYAGGRNNITWKSTNIENVRIEFTTNNGATWSTITESTPSNGVYAWNQIPNVSSLQCRVRISEAKRGIPSDISDNNFTITYPGTQLIKVTSPIGGEKWAAGTPHVITWNAAGISNVKIEYTVNNGISWNTIVASTPSTGFYTWTQVPNIPSTNCKIRISDAADGIPSVESEFFSIGPAPSLKIISPNGNETWLSGSTKEIKWTSENVENVKIEYTTNAGATWNRIVASTPSIGTYMWNNIPDVNNSLLCRVRVSDAVYGTPSAISADNFAIMNAGAQQIKVTSPNGLEKFPVGSSQTITWDAGGIANVKIEYTVNNGNTWNTIVASTPSNGFYTWNPIPNTISTNCKVRVSDASDGNPYDDSDNFFSIIPAPDIKVVSPNGGESLQSGTNTQITWNAVNIAFVKIEYTTNGGAVWNTIVNSFASTGSYPWTIPNVNSTQCKIRISDADNGVPFDLSDNNFSITNQTVKSIKVTSPNGGEKWREKQTRTITWDSKAIPLVNLSYTINNGLAWLPIITNLPSSGSFDWTIPTGINSTQCKIRVSDSSDNTVSDDSDAPFSILLTPAISQIIFPANGSEVIAGEPVTIRWESTGISVVKIEYNYKDVTLPQNWITLADSIQNTGSFQTSFSVVADNYVVRISSTDKSASLTSGIFKVKPAANITILKPNGKEQWIVNSPSKYEITWHSLYVENVKIEWSTNGGSSWRTITDSTPSDGIYSWSPTLPDSSDNCLVRISDAANGKPSAVSADFFSIHQNKWIRVISPNGGETYRNTGIGSYKSPMEIVWSTYAVPTNVNVYYSIDNGVSWVKIVNNQPSTGAYVWNFPTTIFSALARIKVEDATNPALNDVSDAFFYINVDKPVGANIKSTGNGKIVPLK